MAEMTIVAPAPEAPKTPPSHTTRPPLQQTPIARKSVTQPFSMDATNEMKSEYEKIAFGTKGHYLVGMEPQTFFKEFLPWNTSTPNNYKKIFPSKQRLKDLRSVVPERGQNENVMYKPFVDALNGWVTQAALKRANVLEPQTLRFLNTKLPDTSCAKLNPDVSTYWNRDFTNRTNFSRQQTHEEFKPDIRHDAFQHASDEGPNDGQEEIAHNGDEVGGVGTDVDVDKFADDQGQDQEAQEEDLVNGNVELDHEVIDDAFLLEECQEEPKEDEAQDEQDENELFAFDELEMPKPSPLNVETDTESGIHTRGQIAAYAGIALSMAFRKHLFSMLILGRYARFIRWDRCGAIVTRRFDYTKQPILIFQFYQRYGQLTRLQRGFDTTVELHKRTLPLSVRNAFEHYNQSSWYGGTKFKRGNNSLSFDGFFHMEVADDKQGLTETFFIPPPRYRHANLHPFCRATRRSLACAYDEQKSKCLGMCFMKDSWQEDSPRTEREANIYRRLKEAGVKHVASMRLGGDVVGLETETQKWVELLSPNSNCLKGKLFGHRVILDTIARDLSTFSWCKVLLSCIADVVEAARQAYKAGILHRDLSAGNIMIVKDKGTKEWRGILIDWDMCLLWNMGEGKPRSGRTGTLAFISAHILRSTGPILHTLWDDMESAFWVLLYEALQYIRHPMYPVELYRQMQYIFSDGDPEGGRGHGKVAVLALCTLNQSQWDITQFTKPGLNELLDKLGTILYTRYRRKGEIFNLDDPDSIQWFTACLREAAEKMEPLSITPTGLKSPTNDSKPPEDRQKWEPASVSDSEVDYYQMPYTVNPRNSTNIQKRQVSEISSGFIHGMDGSLSNKRPHISEVANEEEEPQQSKKQRT